MYAYTLKLLHDLSVHLKLPHAFDLIHIFRSSRTVTVIYTYTYSIISVPCLCPFMCHDFYRMHTYTHIYGHT
ncbi:hypothetical protein HanIR_Chr16g0820271 [Helianthus annuus]|nr:hypothetical protein HanIR_Chr16g0820271 [Helianthus annuus]